MRRLKNHLRFNTKHYSIAFNAKTGKVDSLRDKATGKEFLAKPGGALVVREDTFNAWGGWINEYGKIIGKFRCPTAKELTDIAGDEEYKPSAAVQVIESGPIATVVEVVEVWNRSVARLRYTLYANHPHVGLEVLVNWAERNRVLQLVFPTAMDSGKYEVDIPFGKVERPEGGGEEPCGRWTMLGSADKKTAFALVNDGPGGVDVRKGELRQALVRSPIYCAMVRHNGAKRVYEHTDLGEHIFKFALRFGKASATRASLSSLADDLTMPPTAHVHIPLAPAEKAGLKPEKDTLELKGKSVRLEALKQSEDGKALIARLVETQGRAANAEFKIQGLPRRVKLRFTPFEIKTLRIERTKKGCVCRECDLLERLPKEM